MLCMVGSGNGASKWAEMLIGHVWGGPVVGTTLWQLLHFRSMWLRGLVTLIALEASVTGDSIALGPRENFQASVEMRLKKSLVNRTCG